MAGFKTSSDDHLPIADINVTPLVDVMLVLLVIFMVTTPLMETGIPIQLPKAQTKAITKEQDPIILSMTRTGELYIGKANVSRAQLVPKLQAEFQGKNNQEVLIRADGALPYAAVAETMAMLKNVGIHKIGLVTSMEGPKKESRKKKK